MTNQNSKKISKVDEDAKKLIIEVMSEELTGGFEVLIGMDIIGAGDFAVTNSNGKTVMSYRYPSIERIDFVEMANEQNARLILKKAPDGRYLVSKKHKRVNKKKAERNNRRQGRKAKKH